MFNPHPPLSAVPGVLLTVTVCFELAGLSAARVEYRRIARILLRLVAVVTPLTYYSGYWGAEYASQTFTVDENIIAGHQALAQFFLISLVPLVLLSFLDKSRESSFNLLRALYLLCLLLSFALVILTSTQGGELVFRHGAGVNVSD